MKCIVHAMCSIILSLKCMKTKFATKLANPWCINILCMCTMAMYVCYVCYMSDLYHILEVNNQRANYKQLAKNMSNWLSSHSQHEKWQV